MAKTEAPAPDTILGIFASEKKGYKLARGRNFTSDSLRAACPSNVAIEIASIVKREDPKVIHDICAGMGTNSIAFSRLDMHVIAHEHREDRLKLLNNNIEAFAPSVIVRKLDNSLMEDNAVVFMDVAMKTKKLEELSADGNTLADMTKNAHSGPKTIYMRVLSAKSDVFEPEVFNLSDGTKLVKLDAKVVRRMLHKKKRVVVDERKNETLIITPLSSNASDVSDIDDLDEDAADDFDEDELEDFDEDELEDFDEDELEEDNVDMDEAETQDGDRAGGEVDINDENAWINELREFLYNFMEPFITDEKLRMQMVSQKAMTVWGAAFTHETFNHDYNYEELEILGDRMCEPAFVRYLFEHYGKGDIPLTKGLITIVKNKFMSKAYQAMRGKEYEFYKYLRMPPMMVVSIDTHEDLYEAFVGALTTVADTIPLTNGGGALGMPSVESFINWDFRDVKIDLEKMHASGVTFVQQSLRKLQFIFNNKAIEQFTPDVDDGLTESGTMKIVLSDWMVNQLNWLMQNSGLKGSISNVIGEAHGDDEKEAKNAAYDAAFDFLESVGMDNAWFVERRREIVWGTQGTARTRAVYVKIKEMGYDDIEVFVPRVKGVRGVTVQLLGIKRTKVNRSIREIKDILETANAPNEKLAITKAVDLFVPQAPRLVERAPASRGGYSSGASRGGYSSGASRGGYSSGASRGGYSSGASRGGYSSRASRGGYSSRASRGGYSSGASRGGYGSSSTASSNR